MRQRPVFNLPITSRRANPGPERSRHPSILLTEYQESYVHPKYYTTMAVATSHKDRYHALKGTVVDNSALRKIYVSRRLHPTFPPKDRKQKMQPTTVDPSCAKHAPKSSVPKEMPSVLDGYTSIYKDSYQAWKINKREPYKLSDSLKVNQGLVVTNGTYHKNSVHAAGRDVQDPPPIESVTSYRYDYVSHPLQPRTRREKPEDHTKGLPLQLTANPKLAHDVNQEQLDRDSELEQHFRNMALENELYRGKTRQPSPPEDDDHFLSTTHADFTAHNCERTKPYLPPMRSMGKQPFQGISTMKDDFRAWDTPRRFPTLRKDQDFPRASIISHRIAKHAESKTTLAPLSPDPKLQETEVCTCTCNANRTTPAEYGEVSILGSIAPRGEDSTVGWSSSLNKVTWAKDGICAEACEDHQLLSCLASDRS